MPVNAQLRAAANISAGDSVTVALERDTAPRVVEVPADLASALKSGDRLAILSRWPHLVRAMRASASESELACRHEGRSGSTIVALAALARSFVAGGDTLSPTFVRLAGTPDTR
jgi:hypothetical protein